MRSARILAAGILLCLPLGALACSKPEPPPPTPSASDDDEKDKKPKKKKKSEDEDKSDTGAPADEPTATAKPVGVGTAKPAPSGSGGTSAADKAKLSACCTALHNSAAVAGLASSVPSVLPPGVPAPPPPPNKAELEKAAKECDAAVNNWNGDLNSSLKKVKGASAASLPNACLIAS